MKRFSVFILVICLMLTAFSAFAEASVTVDASLDIEDFYVEITASGLTPYSRAMLVAVPEGSTPAEVLSDGTAVYVEQAEVGTNGKIERRIMFSASAEPIKYSIYVIDGDTYVSKPFQYLIASLTVPAQNAVNSASAASMHTALKGCDVSLALDMTEYNSFAATAAENEAYQKSAASIMHSLRPAGGFADIKAIHDAFGASVAAVGVPLADDPIALLEKYASEAGIDISQINSCSNEEKKVFSEVIKTKTFSGVNELKDGYAEAVFVAKLRCASTAGELQNYFLNTYFDVLNPDLSDYNRLTSPGTVFAALYNNRGSISGYADAAAKFASAAASALSSESSKPSAGGGSGSGSSGGFPAVSTAAPEALVDASVSYMDLAGVGWAAESIEFLTERSVVSGDGNGCFRPNDAVTRAEFLKILICAFDIRTDDTKTEFDDVADDAWYSPYIAAGVRCGIVNGISEEKFAPDSIIKREDIAVMCRRAADYINFSITPIRYTSLTDFDEISSYASESVQMLYQSGIINGYEDGSFRPGVGATRAEVAKIAASLLQKREAVN